MALSTGQRIGWGLADLGIVIFVMVKQLLVFDFLTSYLGVPAGTAGLVTTAILVFDIITDPIVGYMSDKTNSRWGRRAPWIAVGAVVMVIGTIGMFAAPAANGDAWQAPVMWLGAFFVLATIGFTMAAIPYAATAGEMTDDPGERSIMLGYRMAFASVGILIGGGVIPLLAGGTRDGTFMAVVMISPVVLISIWGSLYATRHAPRVQTPSTQQMFETLRLVFRNTPFLVLVVFYGIMTLAIAQITAGMPLAAKYLVDGGNLTLLFAPFVVGAMASQILWTLLSLRMGKAPAMAIGVMCYIGVTALLYVALPSTSLALIMGLMLLAGIANGAYQAIPWAMYPDLMDVTRHDTGAAIEGAFSAVWLFGQKVANALAPLLLGGYIMAAGWRETTEGTVDQSDAALAALHQAMTVMPMGIFCVAAVVFLGVYRPMTRRFLRTL